MTSYQTVIKEQAADNRGTNTMTITGGFVGDRTDNATVNRMPAFIGLAREHGGVYVENGDGLTVDQALTRAGLDFTVQLREFQVPDGDNAPLPGPTRLRATVGTWPDGTKRTLGVAGKGYHPVQPVQAAHFGQAVLDEGGASIVAAAAYGDPLGSRMYLALKMPEGLQIGGVDPHDLYLTIGNSFNRETGLWGCIAPIRVRCTNQTSATFYRAPHRFAIRHTGQMEMRITDVRHALEMTGTFAEMYAAAAQRMLAEPMAGAEVDDFLAKLLPTPGSVKTTRGEDSWANKRRTVRDLIVKGELNDVGRGTRYAAYQGVTEWADHVTKAQTRYGRYARLLDGGEVENIKVAAGALLMAGL